MQMRCDQGQRSVGIRREVLVLGPEREPIELVRVEEVVFVVQREGPEPSDRWQRARSDVIEYPCAPLSRSPASSRSR